MSINSTQLLINCDMGEWDAPHLNPCDEAIMPWVDLCNIACGGHAGSEKIIRFTLDLALINNTKIGAHPGYEDRANFGRKSLSLSPAKLAESITRQLDLFLSICLSQNINAHHVKAHGALYHACNHNNKEAEVFINVIAQLCPNLIVLVAPGSELEKLASQEGMTTMSESFIDRRYNNDLSLVSRNESDAVIFDSQAAKIQFELLSSSKIISTSGAIHHLKTKTACIHGDNPNCVQILKTIRNSE